MSDGPPLLQVTDLARDFQLPRRSLLQAPGTLRALDGVDFALNRGRSLGVVGESGSGKTTLARLVMALDRPTAGSVQFDGHDLHRLPSAALRRMRAGLQMVFQDPQGALDPRRSVLHSITEPLRARAGAADRDACSHREQAIAMMRAVGMDEADLARWPHEFSGGQRQRIALARALITRPALVVADEPVSALDVSVQAQVLNLMLDLQDRLGMAYLVISHDMAVVSLLCDEVIVLEHGRIVEQGPPGQLFRVPRHEVTRRLLAAVPGSGARPRG